MVIYVKNPIEPIRQTINKFGKFVMYKINTQIPVVFLYTSNECPKKETRKVIPFTIPSKRIKQLGNNQGNEGLLQ